MQKPLKPLKPKANDPKPIRELHIHKVLVTDWDGNVVLADVPNDNNFDDLSGQYDKLVNDIDWAMIRDIHDKLNINFNIICIEDVYYDGSKVRQYAWTIKYSGINPNYDKELAIYDNRFIAYENDLFRYNNDMNNYEYACKLERIEFLEKELAELKAITV